MMAIISLRKFNWKVLKMKFCWFIVCFLVNLCKKKCDITERIAEVKEGSGLIKGF